MDDKHQLKVMISSTSFDLPEHRKEILEACQRQGMFALRMEDLPANKDVAAAASVKLVDEADIFIGILGSRYGYVPTTNNPKQISVTEMEYNRAVERQIERLMFVMADNHPLTEKDVEIENAEKRKALKERVLKENIANFFKSPDELNAKAIHSLGEAKKALETVPTLGKTGAANIREVPTPPEPYIAHPYLLLQTPELIGRRAELDLLNEWVSNPNSDVYKRHIFSVVAIGGLGKSALTWQWFNESTPGKMPPMAGRMWWSFYDPNADFENFVLHALSYVSDSPIGVVRDQLSPYERETKLLATLNQNHFLIVLDGFERVLNAYARADAKRLDDTEVDLHGNARKTTDPRVGQFIKKLVQTKNSRILISTRVQPKELESEVDDPLPGVYKYNLESLPDTDAIELWKRLGVMGARDVLLPLFRQFDKHTLLLQVLAGEVRRFRPAPGNLEKWKAANPKFNPAQYSRTKDRTAHVLEFPLSGLSKDEQDVLNTIVAFRNPPSYATLKAILIGDGKPCTDNKKLDQILTDLEDRGLLGWNRKADRYEIHPIVRNVVWNRLGDEEKKDIYANLHVHFKDTPIIGFDDVNSFADLEPTIELFYALIGMKRYDDAFWVFYQHLSDVTLYRLSVSWQREEMLEMLFPEGTKKNPSLDRYDAQGYAINSLAATYQHSGQPFKAAPLVNRFVDISLENNDDSNLIVARLNQSEHLRTIGDLCRSERVLQLTLELIRQRKDYFHEGYNLHLLGIVLAVRGKTKNSSEALQRSMRLLERDSNLVGIGAVKANLAALAIWMTEYETGVRLAERSWELAVDQRLELHSIRASRLHGEATLGMGNFIAAGERLHHALLRAKSVNLIEEELPTLIALAELVRRQGDEKAAREFLEDVWEYAERGPYPLLHADALNVLAQIERDVRNTDKAIDAATKAYQLAWCDGPPYAYHWGLIKAQKHLEELGASLPDMPAFDESKYEPMPEVEINPKDEFHHGTNKQEPDLTSNRQKKAGGKRKKPRRK